MEALIEIILCSAIKRAVEVYTPPCRVNHALALIVVIEYSSCKPPNTDFAKALPVDIYASLKALFFA